jgi:HMG (high mobility group) box
MSAFLAYSNKRRAALKRENPEATNADLSKMLSKTWKEISDDVRKQYMEEEAGLRATYKIEVAKWRKKVAEEKKLERVEREAVAMQTAEARAKEPPMQMMAGAMNNLVATNRNNQFNVGNMANPGNMGGMLGPGQVQQQDMNGGLQAGYGNPYTQGGQLGHLGNNFAMSGGQDASQYASLMGGGNPFGPQSFMGNSPSQQQLLSLFGEFDYCIFSVPPYDVKVIPTNPNLYHICSWTAI